MSDQVRVLRVIEYIGPRDWVEKTLNSSIQGERSGTVAGASWTIRTATLGQFPEVLNKQETTSDPQ